MQCSSCFSNWFLYPHFHKKVWVYLLLVPLSVRPSEEFLVTWTPSTSEVTAKSWNLGIWLGMSCRFAIRFLNFHYCPWGQLRAKQWRFCEVVVTETLSALQRVDKWYSRISLGKSWRCAITFRNFHFIPRGQMRVKKRGFPFSVMFVIWTTF